MTSEEANDKLEACAEFLDDTFGNRISYALILFSDDGKEVDMAHVSNLPPDVMTRSIVEYLNEGFDGAEPTTLN